MFIATLCESDGRSLPRYVIDGTGLMLAWITVLTAHLTLCPTLPRGWAPVSIYVNTCPY